MMLPNINQQAQGLNVQAPRVPSGNQMMGATSQARANMPQRPVQSMAPDNGQHGGAQRYMTPMSGAMNRANQRPANPYGNRAQVYPGQAQPQQTAMPQAQAMANQQAAMPQVPQAAMPQMFSQPMQQYGQAIQQPQAVSAQQQQAQPQRQMPYNTALQQRMIGRGMPQMFGPVGP